MTEFKQWVKSKYSENYSKVVYWYVKKYHYLIDSANLRELEMLSSSVKNNVVKSLIILSKYLGIHQQFKQQLLDYGIKLHRQDSFTSFLRILNVNNNKNDILNWYREAQSSVRDNEKTLLKFTLFVGLRKEEAIKSFNKIIELKRENKLAEYYNEELNCLTHFKYKDFIRKTKNCFISFIPENLIREIANNEPITYEQIRKRLQRHKMKVRINELRDYFGTFLLQPGILEPEINLLQGRIPPSIFIKHYWSPKLSELRDRIFKALKDLESTKRI